MMVTKDITPKVTWITVSILLSVNWLGKSVPKIFAKSVNSITILAVYVFEYVMLNSCTFWCVKNKVYREVPC